VIVVGIDPHKKTHTAIAICAATGQVQGQLVVPATDPGHRALVAWIADLPQPARVALEGVRKSPGAWSGP
jgi:hypothetical protein